MKILLAFLVILSSLTTIFAAEPETTSTGSTSSDVPTTIESSTQKETLSITDIVVNSSNEVKIDFNMNVVVDGLRLRIDKQSDNSLVAIEAITSTNETNSSASVILKLKDTLLDTTSYKLTVISAASDSGVNMKEGVDAIKEFSTPVLPKAEIAEPVVPVTDPEPITLNAPANPAAVMAPASTSESVPTTATATTVSTTQTPAADTLPATGVNPLFLLLIAFPLVLLFLRKKV